MKRLFLLAVLSFLSFVAPTLEAASTEGKANLLGPGSAAPDFKLTDVISSQTVAKDDFLRKKALLVTFICRHCPYVQNVKKGLAEFGRDYQDKDIAIVAISANDPAAFEDDRPESLKEMAEEEGFNFPFLFDETQEVAKAYTAVATPDFFLFDQDRKLVYRGQFDDSRPGGNIPVTGKDVRSAVDAVLSDQPVPAAQKPAIGCSIKWKSGNAPAYV